MSQTRVWRLPALAVAAAIFVAACGGDAASDTANSIPVITADPVTADLQDLLDELIAHGDVPAIGVTVFDSNSVIESAVAGARRRGDTTPAEETDVFHLGSNTKSMTATLAATFVDEGLLRWDTSVAEVFGDVIDDVDEAWTGVTLQQLLSHTSGIDDQVVAWAALANTDSDIPATDQRLHMAELVLASPPQQDGGEHAYSNVGYTLVGAMLEQIAGEPWETLIQARVFDPLGLDSCGFYAPGTPGLVDQPWGHYTDKGGAPIDPGDPEADNPQLIGPAGAVHCSMGDWALFLQSQLRGFEGGGDEVISAEAFTALGTPAPGTEYGLGWGVIEAPKGLVITHNGSNNRFASTAWLIPGEDWGMLVVTNIGEATATPTIGAAVEAMITRHLVPRD